MRGTWKSAGGLSVVAAMAVIVSGCSHHDSTTSTSGPTSSTSPSSQHTKPSHSSSEPTKPPKSPLATPSVKPVIRNGVRPHPSISAAAEPFNHTVTYPDGVRLTVTAIHQGRVAGSGPGVVAGPRTTFDLRFTNHSHKAIDLDQVVPTAAFGKPSRVARPVYDEATQDFTGTVTPGASTTASYAFSIPVAELSDVTIHLDFDGRHFAATFHGSARR